MDALQTFNATGRVIAEAFLDLMGMKPYEKITVKELTEHCNVARTTFYRHFEDTYDLLEQIERCLLDCLSLYRVKGASSKDERAGKPFESVENWFETGIALRSVLGPLMGKNGDVYFKERLQAQVRRELNVMMNDDRAPNDRLRPYYVALLASAHIGLLAYVVSVEDASQLISAHDMAVIANSGRTAYYRCTEGAPPISNEQLFGRS